MNQEEAIRRKVEAMRKAEREAKAEKERAERRAEEHLMIDRKRLQLDVCAVVISVLALGIATASLIVSLLR